MTEKIVKSDTEWRDQLSQEQYRVTRQAGTERPFTSPLNNNKIAGTYHCICCHAPLFSSEAKYDSGTGWPSFFQPIATDAVATKKDGALGMERVEALCARCDAHLGHVFPDGPEPTGERYCMNGAALTLKPQEDS